MAWTHEGGKLNEGHQEDHVLGQHQGGGRMGGQGNGLAGQGTIGNPEGGDRAEQHILQRRDHPD
eukprot:1201942-Heterocapsa_arctica.AAC.1